MPQDPQAAWELDAGAFPAEGSESEKLRFLLRYAILAPSGHNTQPWLFRIAADRVDIFADRRRALPVVDPQDRELVISCGAALGVLRTAMRRFGHAGAFSLVPDPAKPDLLATAWLGHPYSPNSHEIAWFEAITQRRSTRLHFDDVPLPQDLLDEIRSLSDERGVEVAIITERKARSAIASLVAEGDREQFANPAFRRELADWIHSRRSGARDGMSLASFGAPDILSGVGGLAIRTFDVGNRVGANDEQLAAGSPALAVFASSGDTARAWLEVGIAHVGALLTITADGLTAAYLNQPVEVGSLRPRLRAVAGASGIPQILLRLGRAPRIEPAVRRDLDEVILS